MMVTLTQRALLSIIEYINTTEGVEWVTMEQICDDFKSRNHAPAGALLPAKRDAILSSPGKKSTPENHGFEILIAVRFEVGARVKW